MYCIHAPIRSKIIFSKNSHYVITYVDIICVILQQEWLKKMIKKEFDLLLHIINPFKHSGHCGGQLIILSVYRLSLLVHERVNQKSSSKACRAQGAVMWSSLVAVFKINHLGQFAALTESYLIKILVICMSNHFNINYVCSINDQECKLRAGCEHIQQSRYAFHQTDKL